MNDYKLRERYDRARTENIKILSSAPDFFVVKGSTGTPYNVWLETKGLFCTCKDAENARWHKIPLCKHRMLVLIHGFFMGWDEIRLMANQMFRGESFAPLKAPPGVTYVDPRETDSCVICLEELVREKCAEPTEKEKCVELKGHRYPTRSKGGLGTANDMHNDKQKSKEPAEPKESKTTYPYCKAQCGTEFHEGCIKGWLAKNSTCPLCRSRWIWV